MTVLNAADAVRLGSQEANKVYAGANLVWERLMWTPAVMNAVQFSSINGQSLGQSHSGGADETFVQEFQAKAFPAGKITTTFADLVPAIVTNFQILGGASYVKNSGEGPIYGVLGAGYQFGNALTDMSAQHRIAINSAKGSTIASQHQKSQATFTSTIAAATAAKNYAVSIGKAVFDMGFGWFQGEGNGNDSKATYQAQLIQIAYDYSVDRLAISGQDPSMPPAMFTYTTQSRGIATGTRDGVARAQHQAAIDYFNGVTPAGKPGPVPVFLSAPNYFMSYRFDPTGVHVPAAWSYMMGAYVALAQMHVYMMASALPFNRRFPPIHPIAVAITGAEMIVTYQMRVPGTVLEWGVADYPNGEGIPLQQDYGFAAHDGTALVAMLTPVIIAPNQIKFTLASGVWANGYRLGYALDRAAAHHTFYIGGCGNLRDNYGDTVRCTKMNLPMHNWAAAIDINIGAAGAWSIS